MEMANRLELYGSNQDMIGRFQTHGTYHSLILGIIKLKIH